MSWCFNKGKKDSVVRCGDMWHTFYSGRSKSLGDVVGETAGHPLRYTQPPTLLKTNIVIYMYYIALLEINLRE